MKNLNIRCLVILIVLVALVGCEKAQRVITDGVPSDTHMETIPVRLVLFIDYPEGGKEAYLAWVASIAPTMRIPQEILRIRVYENANPQKSPNRLVEFEFNSFLDMATYLNRPEIAAIFADLPNHANKVATYTFIQDVDSIHLKEKRGDWQIKYVFLINFFPSGKQAYLEWISDTAPVVIGQTQLQTVSRYDNYYGESPHRLFEAEFATQEDADAFDASEEVIQTRAAEREKSVGKWSSVLHKFKLRSDYINP